MTTTLDWLGCATFRLTIGRLVVFLDAYIDRVPSAMPTGITIDEIEVADWIVVGHSHFDHLYGAERIAARTGARIVGSYESVRVMREQGIPEAQLLPVAGGERVRLSDDVTVDVFPSQHSCIWSTQPGSESGQVCLGDLGVTVQEQRERLGQMRDLFGSLSEDVIEHVRVSNQGPRGDGGALSYLFETPEGSLLYQDTSGHWSGIYRDLRPDVAILAAAGRGNVDGEPIQGSLADFIAREVDLLRARRVFLSHHDDWLPGFSSEVEVEPIRQAISRVRPRSELVEMPYLAGYPVFKELK